MHASKSTILLTLSAGAGFGLAIFTVAIKSMSVTGSLSMSETVFPLMISILLVTIGLMSAVFHLANPKNVWRSFTRWRTSWLAREGVLGVLYYPIILIYLSSLYFTYTNKAVISELAGFFLILISLATVYAQGMIYACLRTIRQWNTMLVPLNFLFMGLASGSTIFSALQMFLKNDYTFFSKICIVIIIISAVVKTMYYIFISRPSGSSINTALGFSSHKVRILDQGHTFNTFLTDEFGMNTPFSIVLAMKIAVYILAFFVPIICLLIAKEYAIPYIGGLAVVSILVGIYIERWLFWVEANHVINLYHGEQYT